MDYSPIEWMIDALCSAGIKVDAKQITTNMPDSPANLEINSNGLIMGILEYGTRRGYPIAVYRGRLPAKPTEGAISINTYHPYESLQHVMLGNSYSSESWNYFHYKLPNETEKFKRDLSDLLANGWCSREWHPK